MKTIRVPKPRDPPHDEIQARIAAKRAAGKREPVPAPYAYPAAIYAVAEAMRPAAVVFVLAEVR